MRRGLRAILTLVTTLLWVIATGLMVFVLDTILRPEEYPAEMTSPQEPIYGPQPDGTYRLSPDQLRGRCELCVPSTRTLSRIA